jgi:protein O-GlcNAc transferase
MELTLDETLQKAVEAHEAGQSQEADRLYTAILQAQPKHPDANHNMGVLAVGVNKMQEALAYFKTALEANSSIGQYWLSYIDALIQLDQIVDAQTVLEQAKGKGASGEAFEQLEQRLKELNETQVEADLYIDGQNQVRPNVLDSLKLDQAIRLAKKKAKEGSPEDSNRIYNDILARFPKNKRALDGIKSLSGGFIGKASKVKEPPQDQQQRLINLYQQGQFQQALDSAKQLLSQFPNSLILYDIQGAANAALGQFDASIDSYKQALKIKPDYAGAYYNMGAALKDKGDLEAAIGSYNKALKIKPNYAEAHNNIGSALKDKGDLEAAIGSYKKALKIKPDYAEAYSNMGNALKRKGDLESAIDSYKQALKNKPDFVEAYYNMGNVLKDKGDLEAAIDSYKQAIRIKPDLAEAYNNMGTALNEEGDLEAAIDSYEQAIKIRPNFADAYLNMGNALKDKDDLEAAIDCYQQAIKIKPDYAEAHSNLGTTLLKLGRLEEAVASFNRAIEFKIDFPDAYNNKNLCLNYFSSGSPLFIFEQHLEFGKQFGGLQTEPLFSPRSNIRAEKRLRVGYVSGDFRQHSVAYFFEPLLQHHNSNVVEIFCYYNNVPIDEMTERLMATSDHWRSIVGITDSDVANLIRNDKIDILVDLSGHTSKNRLLVFAQKPAPIQVTWLGYANTTGLSEIDYRFTDIIADPIGDADELHSETLVRLANGFQCYKGNEAFHSNSELPFKKRGHITFGSFNNLTKVTPEVIKVWSNILHALPKSCLVLKAKQLQYDASHYLDCFKQEGIAEDRIKLNGHMPSMHDHLELYNSIDICLDPFPYNGATTTCEALWMGVPVITLLGDRHVGRVGASILTNVGLTDFIAQDIDGYIQLAVEMAANTNYLKEIREDLRERMQRAPLCDGRSFASDVESAYQEMWHCYQK